MQVFCHPERSEGSQVLEWEILRKLRMTLIFRGQILLALPYSQLLPCLYYPGL